MAVLQWLARVGVLFGALACAAAPETTLLSYAMDSFTPTGLPGRGYMGLGGWKYLAGRNHGGSGGDVPGGDREGRC